MPKKSGAIVGEAITLRLPAPAGAVALETFIPWTLVKRGVHREVITPIDAPAAFTAEAKAELRTEQEKPILRALGLAFYWQQLLESGKFASISELAAAEGMDPGQASRIARLALLSPRLVERVVNEHISLAVDKALKLPADWIDQSSL